jgi:hypothetical protein
MEAMGARTWTPEQRQKQAEAIRRWKPWEKSTGPKSAKGKANVSRNAYTGGEWQKLRLAIRVLNQVLREQKHQLE